MSYEQKRRHDSRDYDDDYDEVLTHAPRMMSLENTESIEKTVSRRPRRKVKVTKYIEKILPTIPEKERPRMKRMRPPTVSETMSNEIMRISERWGVGSNKWGVGDALTPSQRRLRDMIEGHEVFLESLFEKKEEKVPWPFGGDEPKAIMRIEARPYPAVLVGHDWIDPCCVCGRKVGFRQGTSFQGLRQERSSQGLFPMMIHKSCRRVILDRRRTGEAA